MVVPATHPLGDLSINQAIERVCQRRKIVANVRQLGYEHMFALSEYGAAGQGRADRPRQPMVPLRRLRLQVTGAKAARVWAGDAAGRAADASRWVELAPHRASSGGRLPDGGHNWVAVEAGRLTDQPPPTQVETAEPAEMFTVVARGKTGAVAE